MKKETTCERKDREAIEWIEKEAAKFEQMTPAEKEEELRFRQKMSMRMPEAYQELERQLEEMEEEGEAVIRFLAAMAFKYPVTKEDILAFLKERGNEHFYTALQKAH
ncbi:MAG: hypothetical protein C4560_03015 [Nitrospiraceae bacterium]|nr:MAG: hypothetical protein C4560_03015 [Nitrospiraceae bacterium]